MKAFRFVGVLLSCVVAIGVTVAQGAELSLIPVGASTNHVIRRNEITVFTGDTTVTLEIHVHRWDPDRDGDPLLRGYQVVIDPTGYISGDTGALSAARVSCESDSDCFAASECTDSGYCDAHASGYIDALHPNFVFFGLQPLAIVDASPWGFRFLGLIFNRTTGVRDERMAKYAGTLVLDVSADASGTFTVGFLADKSLLDSPSVGHILPLAFRPASITVLRDCNENGVQDDRDIERGTSDDCNENGRPDECEPDCNGNGIADECDIDWGTSVDCDLNVVPDECDPDCNENDVADPCDVAGDTSDDCNENDVPDECEVGWDQDCNGNGQPDLCDLFGGASEDCNGNAIPDECDILSGSSEDCTGNGRPDECEPDCNVTGVADSCDIQEGTSEDLDGDGVPDECVQGFSLVPISATTGHLIEGNEIIVPMGGTTVTLEVRVSGWDPHLLGAPLLYLYQARMESSGYTSGDSGSLSPAQIPCTTDDECFADALCEVSGICHAKGSFYVNRLHPNFVFSGLQAQVGSVTVEPDFTLGSWVPRSASVADPGVDEYAGTLILDVPPDATGTFTVGFRADGNNVLLPSVGDAISPVELASALITVLEDCNENGVSDDIDIAEGTSEDNNGNGIPDECEFALPSVTAEGSRYLAVTPAPDTGPVALRVTSPHFPCLVKYITRVEGVARLVDTPVFAPPSEWGTIYLADWTVVPGTTYQVQAVLEDAKLSLAASASTPAWGDLQPPWGDLSLSDAMRVVDGFGQVPGAPPLEQIDLHPAVPDGVVDFDDIVAAVDAYRGLPYPFDTPCP